MDALKRHGFWIVCGVLLAACLGGYLYVLLGIQSEAKDKVEALKTNRDQIQGWLEKPGDLHGPKETAALTQRAEALRKELKECKDLLKGPKRWAGGFWTPEELEQFCGNPVSYSAAYKDKVKDIRKDFQAILQTQAALDVPADPDTASAEKIRDGAKKLILLREILGILGAPSGPVLQVRSLGFQAAGNKVGAGGEGAAVDANVALRVAERSPERNSYPLLIVADLDLKHLPDLLDRLRASSFNVVLESFRLDKLKDSDQEQLISKGLIPAARQNEVVRVSMACEAYEFLFTESGK